MTANGIIWNKSQLGIDDRSYYTPTKKDICFVSLPT